MRDVLDDDLAELYPVPPDDEVRLARLRARLFEEEKPRRPSRWLGAAAAAVTVVLLAGLVVVLRPLDREAPATLPTKPATSLHEAATALEVTERPAAKYRHVSYLAWEVRGASDPFTSSAFEWKIDVWLPTAADEMVVIFREQTGARRHVAGAVQPDRPLYGELERGPQLWQSFCSRTPCREVGIGQSPGADPVRALDEVAAAMLSPFTTVEEKAALYRGLGETPGITWRDGQVFAEGARTVYTIDPVTGEVTGFEQRHATDLRVPADTVTLSASITYEWTDQRPS
ncbi:hypothetical protein SAMN05216553_105366 [Lentzea fradiae]|uniref:Uncharacterized protein n=1 Tax=Lentzea fradiae TaxID=200378 RepID=A0A1G7RJ90_9PSEU|nr:hypothetical protein [Lentzea fradiae]SDG10802.1 hypothetical protein SAMN05216553_105366 [Lentzea fradiae]